MSCGSSVPASAGDVVITGTCVTPIPITPDDRVAMDFGPLGRIEAAFSA